MKTESTVLTKVRAAHRTLSANPSLKVSAPTPAFHEHTAKGYSWQIIIRAKSRQAILRAVQNLDPNFHLTLDPPSLI